MKITEFSKRLVMCFIWIFAAHTLLTLASVIWPGNSELPCELFGAAIPVYMTVFGGYYGKAAVENAKKIAVNPSESSNG